MLNMLSDVIFVHALQRFVVCVSDVLLCLLWSIECSILTYDFAD